jgi:hypothetical protein
LFVCVFDGFAVKNLLSNTLSHPADTWRLRLLQTSKEIGDRVDHFCFELNDKMKAHKGVDRCALCVEYGRVLPNTEYFGGLYYMTDSTVLHCTSDDLQPRNRTNGQTQHINAKWVWPAALSLRVQQTVANRGFSHPIFSYISVNNSLHSSSSADSSYPLCIILIRSDHNQISIQGKTLTTDQSIHNHAERWNYMAGD